MAGKGGGEKEEEEEEEEERRRGLGRLRGVLSKI